VGAASSAHEDNINYNILMSIFAKFIQFRSSL
jgi:hypothetical protein